MFSFRKTETPVAAEVLIGPGVEFKSIEGYALYPHAFLVQPWAHLGVEAIPVHA
ncbi:MAG: hypothetical protein HY308_03400 [Gammaproteobacteria bacterium]|nr:hypothetical protein [Gammaproteobacteria bacterium]